VDYTRKYRVEPGSKLRLDRIDPGDTDGKSDKQQARAEIVQANQRLRELQYLLYAENRHALLICLQAMDAGGKDGTIRHVLGHMNPQGCRVQPFKAPTEEEAAHDFLWRVHKVTPRRGEVVIFNRSHYEDVLVVRVHELVRKKVWSKRYAAINAFEKQLADSGVRILKFFLHISKEEQLERFGKRLEDASKHWKISESDYSERAFWDDYQRAYEDALEKCSTRHAPWFVIPADHKWYRNLVISRIVQETLESLDMKLPPARVDIDAIRCKYHALAHGDGG